MDSSHIKELEFVSYAKGSLGAADFLRVHAHLENCDECKRRIDDMFPTAVVDDLTTLLDDDAVDTSPEFHLNYEDHFKPYVDEAIGAVDRELIESHAETCLRCRDDLRDIISFHQELKQESELKYLTGNSMISNISAWFLASTRRMTWVAMAGLIILIGAGSMWFYINNLGNAETIAENVESTQVPPVDLGANAEPPADVLKADSANTATGREKGQDNVQSVDETETAALNLPGFIKDLSIKDRGTLRGDNEDAPQKLALVSPDGVVIRDPSPVLRWLREPNIQIYDIALFDASDNRIGGADSISGDKWQVPSLMKGRVYQWQVSGKSTSQDGKTKTYVGQGRFYVVSQQDENRIFQAKDSLARGKAFAEAGLLNDAAVEFRRYLAMNPGSDTARRFLQQVEQAKH